MSRRSRRGSTVKFSAEKTPSRQLTTFSGSRSLSALLSVSFSLLPSAAAHLSHLPCFKVCLAPQQLQLLLCLLWSFTIQHFAELMNYVFSSLAFPIFCTLIAAYSTQMERNRVNIYKFVSILEALLGHLDSRLAILNSLSPSIRD